MTLHPLFFSKKSLTSLWMNQILFNAKFHESPWSCFPERIIKGRCKKYITCRREWGLKNCHFALCVNLTWTQSDFGLVGWFQPGYPINFDFAMDEPDVWKSLEPFFLAPLFISSKTTWLNIDNSSKWLFCENEHVVFVQ